jgi:hypothetical protein
MYLFDESNFVLEFAAKTHFDDGAGGCSPPPTAAPAPEAPVPPDVALPSVAMRWPSAQTVTVSPRGFVKLPRSLIMSPLFAASATWALTCSQNG